MAGRRTGWMLAVLALVMWVGNPSAMGQQQSGNRSRHGKRHTRRTASPKSGVTQAPAAQGVSAGGVVRTPGSIPEGGAPSLQSTRPTATLDTLPNQTMTPGATTVPSNAGGIAPASNDASSGEYTPSEGLAAPTTPGANPSNTQGVPTFSSAAQPADANLPRTVNPINQGNQAVPGGRQSRRQKPPHTSSQHGAHR